MAQFGEVSVPSWELVESLKSSGPLTIYAPAKQLNRHYRNVYKDVAILSEWVVISKDETGKVLCPGTKLTSGWR